MKADEVLADERKMRQLTSEVFLMADLDHNGYIMEDEFHKLMM